MTRAHATTIAALSSGALPSGVAVIRLSGPASLPALRALAGNLPRARSLSLRNISNPRTGETIDRGLIAQFPGPHSFTGEDCAELHIHGSRANVRALLGVLTGQFGIDLAQAGDFTRRAFENGKLDLTAVEGLGDLLAAETEGQRRQALARMEGDLSARIAQWRTALLDARAEIEAHLDFADEDDVPEALPARFRTGLEDLKEDLERALSRYEGGRIVREGFRIVLAGPPNAGKSSLLNALAGSELAIVTDEAGTTRDIKDIQLDLEGHLVVLTDTAGLRDTQSLAEAEGIRRARSAIASADLVLSLVAPDIADRAALEDTSCPIWQIGTKSDLGLANPGCDVLLSTHTGQGISDLLDMLKSHIALRLSADEPALVSHERDRLAITGSIDSVSKALGRIDQPELCAEHLREASDKLARLVGLLDAETVLDRLFAGFCIGK